MPRPSMPQPDGKRRELTETATPASEPGADAAIAREPAGASIDALPLRTRARYTIGDEIARGGLGRILEAYDTELGRRVAIKELLRRDARAEARFVREATITARLEHPAIIPVHEAGRWPDGDPFYAMKLVNGRRLKDVVSEASSQVDRLALLPHVLAVADALAYAHAEGIIHRDLKPSNLLVGAYGETVVIDWGLAKDLGANDAGDDASTDATASADGVTVDGSVVGTPAYMSPEQAMGEPVDQRTDVYAIGAVLYYVLAGRPPYTGARSAEVIAQVRAGAPQPILEVVPDAPADLAAIVDRALARDPAARYADAGALAADLRRFQQGQLVGAHRYSTWQLVRRWIGRHRAAVVVAALMTALLAVGAVVGVTRIAKERDLAETERGHSEEARREAEGLIDFMLVDLHERLEPIGKLDALDMVAERAIAYWAERPIDWSKPDDAHKRAMAHQNLGDVLAARSDRDAALDEYATARRICERLLDDDPTDMQAQRILGLVHGEMGTLYVKGGDSDAAIASFEAYADIFRRQADADSLNGRALREVGVAKNRIGEVLVDRGDHEGALAAHREALAIAEAVSALDLSNASWRFDVAATQTYIARVYRENGDLERALEQYRKAVPTYDAIIVENPDDTFYLRNRAVLHDNVGDMLQLLGDGRGARDELVAAKAIRERLAQWEPDNLAWQFDLADTYDRIGYAARHRGDLGEAFEALTAGKQIRLRLQKYDPSNTAWDISLAMTMNLLGDVFQDRGDLDAALAEYEAAMAIRRRLADSDPDNVEWTYDLALGHDMLGNVEKRKGELEAALADYRASLALRERLVTQTPGSAKFEQKLAMSELNVGTVLGLMGEVEPAREHLARAAPLFERVARSADDHYNAACVFALSGNADKAFAMLEAAAAKGFRMGDWAAKDPDLASLHADPRWAPILEAMRE